MAFEAIYEQTFAFVRRSLRRLGVGAADLDDAIQDVYLVVHRRLSSFEGRSTLTTWIYGIARKIAPRYRARVTGEEHAAPEAVCDGGPYEEVARVEGVDLLGRLLAELPPEKREVFVLAELESLSAPEIARCLSIDLATVYWRLRTARESFERALERHNAREVWRAFGKTGGREESPAERSRRQRCWLALGAATGRPPEVIAGGTGGGTALTAAAWAPASAGIVAAAGLVGALLGAPTSAGVVAGPDRLRASDAAAIPGSLVLGANIVPSASAAASPPARTARVVSPPAPSAPMTRTARVVSPPAPPAARVVSPPTPPSASSARTARVVSPPTPPSASSARTARVVSPPAPSASPARTARVVSPPAPPAARVVSPSAPPAAPAAEGAAPTAFAIDRAPVTPPAVAQARALLPEEHRPMVTTAAKTRSSLDADRRRPLDLAGEARLLLEADRALERGDLVGAERALAAHRRWFRHGQLSHERDGLALALVRASGRPGP